MGAIHNLCKMSLKAAKTRMNIKFIPQHAIAHKPRRMRQIKCTIICNVHCEFSVSRNLDLEALGHEVEGEL